MKTRNDGCFAIRKKLTRRQECILLLLSFALPLLLWCLVSYVPFLYHPLVRVTDACDSFLCAPGDLVERSAFEQENRALAEAGSNIMRGERANPAYLPAPHQVARSLVTAFLTPPRRICRRRPAGRFTMRPAVSARGSPTAPPVRWSSSTTARRIGSIFSKSIRGFRWSMA